MRFIISSNNKIKCNKWKQFLSMLNCQILIKINIQTNRNSTNNKDDCQKIK